MPATERTLSNDIWGVANLLRGDYKRSEYGRVILPFTILRRLDCVLEPTKQRVLDVLPTLRDKPDRYVDAKLKQTAGAPFYNRSRFTMATLKDEPQHIAANVIAYVNGFSPGVREIFEYFRFAEQVDRLESGGTGGLLYEVVKRFLETDLHPDRVDNHRMGTVFEELIRKFAEQSNETAGEHFTPREVIRLMVSLLFAEDRELLTQPYVVRTLYDPACGTGGMLSVAEDHLFELTSHLDADARAGLELFGQEINPESYAICKADMIIKGHDPARLIFGNTFTADGLPHERFDYMLSNPPFGVSWQKVEKPIRAEHERRGHEGRFGAGLPRISDGSLLFLQHMLAKRKEGGTGTRVAIVFNGSPLFAGGAGSGESEIRRWIIEHDWLEAVVALPEQLFYNTGIATYVWIVTNRKRDARRGQVQLIDASACWVPLKKSLGDKRRKVGEGPGDEDSARPNTPDHVRAITDVYVAFALHEPADAPAADGTAREPRCKVLANEAFGYRRVVVERPLRLRFARTAAALARVAALKTLPKEVRDRIVTVLGGGLDETPDERTFANLDAFHEAMRGVWMRSGLPQPSAKQWREALLAMGEPDPDAEPVLDSAGRPVADPSLRDFENVPLTETVEAFFEREVRPFVPDAWVNEKVRDAKDDGVGVVGYEVPFGRHFHVYAPPPDREALAAMAAEVLALERDAAVKMIEVLG